jgi:hypothetical protein
MSEMDTFHRKDARGSSKSPWRGERRLPRSVNERHERVCQGVDMKKSCTDGDDIVVREKPAEDVRRDGGYAEQIQDEEHDGVRGLTRKR